MISQQLLSADHHPPGKALPSHDYGMSIMARARLFPTKIVTRFDRGTDPRGDLA